jgi:hypothetical protein
MGGVSRDGEGAVSGRRLSWLIAMGRGSLLFTLAFSRAILPRRFCRKIAIAIESLHLMFSIVFYPPQSPLIKGGSYLFNLFPPLARGVRGVMQAVSLHLTKTLPNLIEC